MVRGHVGSVREVRSQLCSGLHRVVISGGLCSVRRGLNDRRWRRLGGIRRGTRPTGEVLAPTDGNSGRLWCYLPCLPVPLLPPTDGNSWRELKGKIDSLRHYARISGRWRWERGTYATNPWINITIYYVAWCTWHLTLWHVHDTFPVKTGARQVHDTLPVKFISQNDTSHEHLCSIRSIVTYCGSHTSRLITHCASSAQRPLHTFFALLCPRQVYFLQVEHLFTFDMLVLRRLWPGP